ncbi:MAG: response regulator transcription factor [Gammaproteobacteria bacterium]
MQNFEPLSPPYHVFILDDHRFLGELLAQRLGTDAYMRVLGAGSHTDTLHTVLGRHRIDILIIDMDLGDDDGLAVAAGLIASHPALRVVGLSAYVESHYPLALLDAGGRGFMSKRVSASELVEGVRRVARGDLAISADVAMHLANSVTDDIWQRRLRAITAREREVLCLLARGYSAEEVAEQLDMATKTVQSHRASMKRKLGARNDVELCLMALRAGVVSVREARADYRRDKLAS